jgi:hypothetical protein
MELIDAPAGGRAHQRDIAEQLRAAQREVDRLAASHRQSRDGAVLRTLGHLVALLDHRHDVRDDIAVSSNQKPG